MNILHTVETYLPSRNGMQEVVTRLSEGLTNLGHSVTIATSKDNSRNKLDVNGVTIIQFAISGNSVFGYKGEVEEYVRFLKESTFDLVVNFAAQTWTTDLFFSIIREVNGKKVFVPTGFSGLFDANYKDYYNAMPGIMAMYDMNVFLSYIYRDYIFAKNNGLGNVCVIPNGASAHEFNKTTSKQLLKYRKGNEILLSVGNHTGLKGHADLIKIFKKLPHKRLTLIVAGKSPHSHKGALNSIFREFIYALFGKTYSCYFQCKLKSFIYNSSIRRVFDKKQILMLEGSRSHVVEAYNLAKMFLFTSNVECSPVVIFESIASKTPFATVDVGNTSEIINWTGAGVLLPTEYNNGYSYANVSESVEVINHLLDNGNMLSKLVENGYESYLNRFSWDMITQSYNALYIKLHAKS